MQFVRNWICCTWFSGRFGKKSSQVWGLDETCMSRLVGIVLAELIINRQIFT